LIRSLSGRERSPLAREKAVQSPNLWAKRYTSTRFYGDGGNVLPQMGKIPHYDTILQIGLFSVCRSRREVMSRK
jgi:hypothetical protein